VKMRSLWKKARKSAKRLDHDFSKTPLARASRGKKTKGFI